MDKNYLRLLDIMLLKEPYCSVYMNIFQLVHAGALYVLSCVCGSSLMCGFNPGMVEDLIRIIRKGPELEDFDARDKLLPKGKRSRRLNYTSWPDDIFRAQGDV